jgi:hypothetical protein
MLLGNLAPLDWIAGIAATLVGALVLTSALLFWLIRNGPVTAGPTWGCGFAAPTARIQYTASSFAEMLTGLFAWVLRTRKSRPHDLPLFPQHAAFHSETPDAVLDEGILPSFRFAAWLFSWIRVVQQGNMQMRLLYIFVTLVLFLLWR